LIGSITIFFSIDSSQYVEHQNFTTLIIKGRHLDFLYQVEADFL